MRMLEHQQVSKEEEYPLLLLVHGWKLGGANNRPWESKKRFAAADQKTAMRSLFPWSMFSTQTFRYYLEYLRSSTMKKSYRRAIKEEVDTLRQRSEKTCAQLELIRLSKCI